MGRWDTQFICPVASVSHREFSGHSYVKSTEHLPLKKITSTSLYFRFLVAVFMQTGFCF